MFKAFQLLFVPGRAWTTVVEANRGIASMVIISLFPLLILTAAAEGYAINHWGLNILSGNKNVTLSLSRVLHFEAVQFGVSWVMVIAGAVLIRWLSESFHFYPRFLRCFTVAAFGLSPVFLARLLNCIPAMNIWFSFSLGIVGLFYVLYQGIGIVLEPEQTKGFGLYLLTSIVFAFLSTMAHMINLMVLGGKF